MSPVFARGDLRLYLLKALAEEPRHGYELIRLLEDRFLGMYTPSPGTIYPRLGALEEDGLIEHEEKEGRKVYRLTDAGRAELARRRDETERLEAHIALSARDVAREVRDEVRASVRDLRRDLRDAVLDVRREERRVARSARETARDGESGPAGDADHRQHRRHARSLGSLQSDLEAFVADVLTAARRHRLDRDRVREVREALLDARAAVMAVLSR